MTVKELYEACKSYMENGYTSSHLTCSMCGPEIKYGYEERIKTVGQWQDNVLVEVKLAKHKAIPVLALLTNLLYEKK